MMWIGTHVLGLLFLICVGYGTGDLVRRRGFKALDGPFQHLANVCLGLASWLLFTFFLATLQKLSSASVFAGLGLLAALSLWGWWQRRGFQPTTVDSAGASGDPPTSGASFTITEKTFLTLVGLLVLLPLAVLAMVPSVSWDASAYHLTVPRLFLEHGGFRPVDFNVYSNWPLGTEMLFALAMMLDDHVLAKLLHFALGLATLYAISLGARTSQQRSVDGTDTSAHRLAGLLAMACFLANAVVAFEMRVAYVDIAHAFYFLSAYLFLRRAQESPVQRHAALCLAGICCGLMAASKLNGIVGILPLAWVWIPVLAGSGDGGGWKGRGKSLLVFAAPIAVLWIPWLIKSFWYTGNPVYPILYGLFGGPDWNAALADQLAHWQRSIGMGRDPVDYLLLPLRVVLAGGSGYERFDGEVGLFWIAVLPIAFWAARRSLEVRRLLAVAATFFVLWAFTSQQLRLLIPALPLLALAGGLALVQGSSGRLSWRRPLLLILALIALGTTYHSLITSSWNALRRMAATPATAIQQTARPPIFAAIDGLPAEARLLMLNTNQGFFCHREFLADSFFEASQISHWLAPFSEPADVHDALRQRGISHLLLDRQPRPVTYPPALLALVQSSEWVVPVTQSPDGRFLLFALR